MYYAIISSRPETSYLKSLWTFEMNEYMHTTYRALQSPTHTSTHTYIYTCIYAIERGA